MKKSKTTLVLARLAEDSRNELTAMQMELAGATLSLEGVALSPRQWNRRFAASGKIMPLRPIRMS
jgi:hypothetical protein